MLTYVTDVCWHALVIPCFRIVAIFRYNGGSSFVKLKFDRYRRETITKDWVNLSEQSGVNLSERYRLR